MGADLMKSNILSSFISKPKSAPSVICVVVFFFILFYLAGTGLAADNNSRLKPSDNTLDRWKTVEMRVTAYCPCEKCCGQYADGITANGHKISPQDFFVAADKTYAFGTEMFIDGYGNGKPVKVLDRGGAIRGNKLDVFFHTHQQALQWGVRYIEVRIRI